MDKSQVKQWVVIKSHVGNPYGKYWSASVTLGSDLYGEGQTIEDAYNDLTDQIFNSPFYSNILKDNSSFKAFNPKS